MQFLGEQLIYRRIYEDRNNKGRKYGPLLKVPNWYQCTIMKHEIAFVQLRNRKWIVTNFLFKKHSFYKISFGRQKVEKNSRDMCEIKLYQ